MTDLPDAKECRQRALIFAKRLATCASPKARARFTNIAKSWMALRLELEHCQPDGAGQKRQRRTSKPDW
jgi:hypothetical protein